MKMPQYIPFYFFSLVQKNGKDFPAGAEVKKRLKTGVYALTLLTRRKKHPKNRTCWLKQRRVFRGIG